MEQVNAFNDEREVHNVNFFRNGVNFFRILVSLFRKAILRKRTLGVKVFCCSSLGCLSVFSRCSLGEMRQGIREGKEMAILIKSLFFYFGVLWSFLGSSLVHPWSFTRSIYIRY